MRKTLAFHALALLLCLNGCAMMGGEEGETAAGGTPRNVDAVHLRNASVVVGDLSFPGGRLRMANEVLPELAVEKRHLESLRVLPDGRVKVRTKHGDQLQGRLLDGSILLKSKLGEDLQLPLEDIERITFAE